MPLRLVFPQRGRDTSLCGRHLETQSSKYALFVFAMNGIASLPTLRYASAVAATQSFTEAAKLCGVRQPTVSNAIAALEDELGQPVFARTTRRVTLTPFGEQLMPAIEAVVRAQLELQQRVEQISRPARPLLRVGFSPLVGAHRVALALSPFVEQHPNVELVYKECSIEDLVERMEAGSLDVIFTVDGKKKSRWRSVRVDSEELRYLPRGGLSDEFRERRGVELEEIGRQTLVLTVGDCGLAPATTALFERRRLSPKIYSGQAVSYSVLEEWADLGIGAAILPTSRISHAGHEYPRVLDRSKPVEIQYSAIWVQGPVRPEHLQAFVRYVKDVVPKLLRGRAR